MAVLETIRVKFGILITVLIGVALLSFIVDPNTFNASYDNEQPKGETVAHINGEPVYYTEFMQEYEQIENSFKMQGYQVQTQEEIDYIGRLAWDNVLKDKMYLPIIKDAGYLVPDEEMYLLMSGKIYNEVTAGWTHDDLVNLESMAESDPEYALYYDSLRKIVSDSRYIQKYRTSLYNSDFVNSLMVEDYIKSNSDYTSFDYVKIPYDLTDVEVTDDEVNEYYKNHEQFFSAEPVRDIDYMLLEIKCSPEEVAKVENEFTSLYDEFKSTDDVLGFMYAHSDKNYNNNWHAEGEFEQNIDDFVFGSSASDVSEIIKSEEKIQAVRILDEKVLPQTVTLGVMNNVSGAMIDDIMAEYEAVGIDSLSKIYAFTQQGMMNINDAINLYPDFDLEKPFVVSNSDGTSSLAYVATKGENKTMKKVAIFEKHLIPGEETLNYYNQKAEDFADAASAGYDAFQETVRNMSTDSELEFHDNIPIQVYSRSLNSITNAKSVVKWAFDSDKGDVSDVISIDGKYLIVAAVKETHDDGIIPEADIRQQLMIKKAIDKKYNEVVEEVKGINDLKEIADMYGVDNVLTESNIMFSSNNLDGILVGAAQYAPVGNISPVIKGNDAVYVFKVTERTPAAVVTAEDAEIVYNTNTNMMLNSIQDIIMMTSDIENRVPLYL